MGETVARSLANRRVLAFLWKKLTPTDAQALKNYSYQTGGGAKHLPFRKGLQIDHFVDSSFRTSDPQSFSEYAVPIESPNDVAKTIHIDYVLRGGYREEWLIRRQNAAEQIPAWRPGEKLPENYSEIPGNYIFVFRLGDGSYHARTASRNEISQMPQYIQERILNTEQGIEESVTVPVYLIEDADSNFFEESVDGNWYREEIKELVSSYMKMLAQELNELPYEKNALIDELRIKLNRNRVSEIEQKFRNISSILSINGQPYVGSLVPLFPYDQMLEDDVFQFLSGDDGIRQLINNVADHEPSVLPAIDDLALLIVNPPSNLPGKSKLQPSGIRVPRKILDFQSREDRNRKLGRQGEAFVIELEKKRLAETGLKILAEKIDWVSETQGDGLGYDLRSFDTDGSDIFIEVKTTTMGIDFPFLISANEVRVSEEIGSSYRLYRVFNFKKEPKLYILSGPISKTCQLVPMVFQARVR